MIIQPILILLLSLLLVIISAWSLGTFMRLNKVINNYSNDRTLESACQVSNQYINTGLIVGYITTIVSLIILLIASWNIYRVYSS